MAFTRVPIVSKNRLNNVGKYLIKEGTFDIGEYISAIELAEQWRACHAYPINTFQSLLRKKLASYNGKPIVAQRLKRMPTIIDKLRRYPNMQLTTMQDIGGIRAILSNMKDVRSLVSEYVNNNRLTHELIDEKNYIDYPRSEDGYRSYHLIYKYNNKLASNYNGLRLELQIRTKLQHTWATAVETMGTLLGQALKSRQGDQDWLDFFAITSSAFSWIEDSNPVPRFSHLSQIETFLEVQKLELQLNALEKMRGISGAVNTIGKKRGTGKSGSYHLIILNSLEHSVQVQAFGRENFAEAIEAYSKVEEDAAKGKRIEPVLVSAGPIKTLRRAYPNFFLDISDFINEVTKIIARLHKASSPNLKN